MLKTLDNNDCLRLVVIGVAALGLAACSQESEPEASASEAVITPEPAVELIFQRDPVPPSPTAEQDLLGRGEYLVEGLVGCGNCHNGRDENGEFVRGMEYAGNFVIEEPPFTAYAPNITPDSETGIGDWTDEEIERAIRSGISRDGRVMGPPMPFYPYYHGIASDDMDAIIAYLRSVPAVRSEVPLSEIRMELPPSWGPPVEEPIVAPPRSDQIAYGEYLAHNLGHCTQCHTPLVQGVEDFSRIGAGMNLFPTPFGYDWSVLAANITSHETLGLGARTDDEIKRAIVYGISADGRNLLPFMGFSFYEYISDEDLDAIVAYLRTLPPSESTPPVAE